MNWKAILTLGISYLVKRAASKKAAKVAQIAGDMLGEFEARYRAEEEARFNRMMADALAKIAAAEKGMKASLDRNDLAQDARAARDRRRK